MPTRDPAFAAEALMLPGEADLADEMAVVDVEAIHAARESARAAIGQRARRPSSPTPIARLADPGPYRTDGAVDRPARAAQCLPRLSRRRRRARRAPALAKAQFDAAAQHDRRAGGARRARRYRLPRARRRRSTRSTSAGEDDPLVIDKWFALQARSSLPGTIGAVKELTRHPAFTRANPNRVRALVGAFAQANPLHFHDASGEGYAFLADEVLALDRSNPTTRGAAGAAARPVAALRCRRARR